VSPVAVYAQRLAALPRALSILELHPQGLPLVELAAELGVEPVDLREVFMAYYTADLVELGSLTLPVVEFFAPDVDGPGGADDSEDADADGEVPADAQWVRVLTSDPEHELGVDHLTARQLAALYEAGVDLLALEPANEVLREALAAFESALQPADTPDAAQWGADTAQALHLAAEEHRRVRITYVRQWSPGTSERVVEPYRLVRTRRGWEVDAGPADDVAAVRTYLVSGIVAHEVLDETFEPPEDVDTLLAGNRAAQAVELVVPQGSRWAVERFAESTSVSADDESDVALRAELLPPVEQRLGLLLLCCGPEAFVTSPAALTGAGEATASALLAHHEI
jgi:predicted DNA-binding transcriptional regulator YafY